MPTRQPSQLAITNRSSVAQALGALSLSLVPLVNLQAELEDLRKREIPALQARHKEAETKLQSEVSKLRFAVKEAEGQVASLKEAGAGPLEHQQLLQQLKEEQKAVQK